MITGRRMALWLPLFVLAPINLYLYRQDERSEIRDLGVWIRAAESMLSGKDPYLESGGLFKSGPISPFVLYSIRLGCMQNDSVFFYLIMFLNFVGMVTFISWFLRYFKLSPIQLCIYNSVLISSSFTREVLVNGQITGLLFGCLALLVHLLETNHLKSRFINRLSFMILTVLIIDFKPNIIIFPLLALLLIYRKSLILNMLTSVTLFYSALLIALSFSTKTNLFSAWVKNLVGINNYESNPSLFGTKNFWQVINRASTPEIPQGVFSIMPLFSFVIVGSLGLLLIVKKRESIGVSLTLIAPFFYSYFHYYSFFPIAMVSLFYIAKQKQFLLLGFYCSTYLVTSRVNDNIGFLLISLLLFGFFLTLDSGIRSTVMFSLGWITSLMMRLLISEVLQDEILYMSIVLSSLMIIWTVVMASKHFKVLHSALGF